MTDQNKLSKFASKTYRDGYLQNIVRAGIAYQMRALRVKFGLTQKAFSDRTDKPQSVISRLENTAYGKVTIQTLLDIASALDVALIVRFVSYPEFLKFAGRMSESELQPDTIHETIERGPQAQWRAPAPWRNLTKENQSSDQDVITKRTLGQIGAIQDLQPQYQQPAHGSSRAGGTPPWN